MLLKQLMEVFDILDSAVVSGEQVKSYLQGINPEADVETYPLVGAKGKTDMVRIRIKGRDGKWGGGSSPTIGLLGRLGGIGARPERLGFVSDGDGALIVLAVAAKLLDMQNKGDRLAGDVFISTHICPYAPIRPHHPVPFMDAPVEVAQVNQEEVIPELDAILSVDTTKGNRLINSRGFAISPVVKQGYILRVSEDLLDLMSIVTGEAPKVFPLTMQDITPYGNDLYHLNSILQPATATDVPVVGVAITTTLPVPGCATGASHYSDMEAAARFILEVAKAFGSGNCHFHDPEEFSKIQSLYGSMQHLQTLGRSKD